MAKRTYLWCDNCRRSFDFPDAPGGLCPICSTQMRELGWLNAFVRGVMAQELVASGLPSRHRTLIRMIWTANGMGERYYKALAPPVTYSKFEGRVTEYVCAAASEGWVRFVLPPSPIGAADDAYRMEIDDEERFISEMAALFADDESGTG
ncbi:MAG TPA: hypothetical protein VFV93_04715 [Thermomicrobiales bacterium]|nr:hypothetical protein [Thermomicrobiales bacterium]